MSGLLGDLRMRTRAAGITEGLRVSVACGFEGRNKRIGTIVALNENGTVDIDFDDGLGAGRACRPERCEVLV